MLALTALRSWFRVMYIICVIHTPNCELPIPFFKRSKSALKGANKEQAMYCIRIQIIFAWAKSNPTNRTLLIVTDMHDPFATIGIFCSRPSAPHLQHFVQIENVSVIASCEASICQDRSTVRRGMRPPMIHEIDRRNAKRLSEERGGNATSRFGQTCRIHAQRRMMTAYQRFWVLTDAVQWSDLRGELWWGVSGTASRAEWRCCFAPSLFEARVFADMAKYGFAVSRYKGRSTTWTRSREKIESQNLDILS